MQPTITSCTLKFTSPVFGCFPIAPVSQSHQPASWFSLPSRISNRRRDRASSCWHRAPASRCADRHRSAAAARVISGRQVRGPCGRVQHCAKFRPYGVDDIACDGEGSECPDYPDYGPQERSSIRAVPYRPWVSLALNPSYSSLRRRPVLDQIPQRLRALHSLRNAGCKPEETQCLLSSSTHSHSGTSSPTPRSCGCCATPSA
jgi:hypothetical protein